MEQLGRDLVPWQDVSFTDGSFTGCATNGPIPYQVLLLHLVANCINSSNITKSLLHYSRAWYQNTGGQMTTALS